MNKYKKLVNNSLIFTIGSFGSKFINFFMVPLYTNVLSTQEYGTVDLFITTINLLIPLVTLELGQAALRFTVDTKNEIERSIIFNNITVHGLVITILLSLSTPFLMKVNLFSDYGVLFSLLLILTMFNTLYSQYIRGIGKIKQYAFNGILMTFVTVFFNFAFLVFFEFKVVGYILSLIIANLVSTVYLFTVSKGFKKIQQSSFNFVILKDMIRFSVPIVPNTAMWWIISGSTRYFVLYFVGTSGNGLYAVANKIPSIISMITGIFTQAWQLSSFEEYKSNDKDTFYSRIFNIYYVLLFVSGSALLVVLKPLLNNLVDNTFYQSWEIAPMLIFAVIYQSFSSFLGTNYTASKNTKGTFTTSVYAGIVSLISNIIFIPLFGVVGAGISSALSFLCMCMLRFIDTKKFVKINVNIPSFLLSNVIYIFQTILLFIMDGNSLLFLETLLFMLMVLINREIYINIVNIGTKGFTRIVYRKFR